MKFNFDAIDETDLLEEMLKPRVESIGGTVEKVLLSGNHITPCIQVYSAYCVFVYVHTVVCFVTIPAGLHFYGVLPHSFGTLHIYS